MLKLLSNDHYLRYGLQHLLQNTDQEGVLHLIDVDEIGGFGNIKKYLLSSLVSSEDNFILLKRSGSLAQHFPGLYTISITLPVDDLYHYISQSSYWVSYSGLSKRVDFLMAQFRLTHQQYLIVMMLENGWAPQCISKMLSVSTKTIYTHMNRAKQSYGVRTHAELLRSVRRYC